MYISLSPEILKAEQNLNAYQNKNDTTKYLEFIPNKVSDFSSDKHSNNTKNECNDTYNC